MELEFHCLGPDLEFYQNSETVNSKGLNHIAVTSKIEIPIEFQNRVTEYNYN